jgi:nucleotide-binding universal stress UspA family protein
MGDKQSVLVAVDFGPTSTRAFDKAIELAARLGMELEIVHACAPSPGPVQESGTPQPYEVWANRQLNQLETQARSRGVVARGWLRMETVIFALVEAIEELQPFLVVVGSHGRSGVKRALLGSISESLARRSPSPVLIVPSPARAQLAVDTAWSCSACGHILGDGEATEVCVRCGASPASWISAAMSDGPADIAEPAVGESVAPPLETVQTQGPTALFSTNPPGTEGFTPNPELRIRY